MSIIMQDAPVAIAMAQGSFPQVLVIDVRAQVDVHLMLLSK
jgi:hypothetical protein